MLGTKKQRTRQRSACASKYAFNTTFNDLWDNKMNKKLHGAYTKTTKTGKTLCGTKAQRTRGRSACAEKNGFKAKNFDFPQATNHGAENARDLDETTTNY